MKEDNAAAIAELQKVEASGALERAIKREIVRLKRASLPEPVARTADGVTVRVGDTLYRAREPRYESQLSSADKTVRKARIGVDVLTISEISRPSMNGTVEVRFVGEFQRAHMETYRTSRPYGTQYFSTRAAAWEYTRKTAERRLSEQTANVKEARALLDLTKKAIAGDRKAITRKMQGVRARARGKKAA